MSDIIRLVQGDTKPDILLELIDEDTGLALDLSPATTSVSVKFRAAGSTDTPAIISCTKIDAGNGKVQFDFSGGILDVPAGAYEGEIEVSYDGLTQTVFDVMRFRVREEF
jgi:hypothetical protein